ncbi:hypothetical protein ACIQHY_34335, partial [Streptomyces sp. NPDC092359]
MRGRCTCGWRGTATYAIDWENIPDDGLDDVDVSGPHGDWSAHPDAVADPTVKLPNDLTVLLAPAQERFPIPRTVLVLQRCLPCLVARSFVGVFMGGELADARSWA